MKVTRPIYKDAQGREKHCQKYRADFVDHIGVRRRITLFSNKKESERAGSMIEWLIATGGRITDPDLQRWIESVPAAVRGKLAEFGLIADSGAGKSIADHLTDWKDSLLAKGTSEKHAELLHNRAKRILETCGVSVWSDINLHHVEMTLRDMRASKGEDDPGISHQTHNFYVQALKQFGKWIVRNGRAMSSPFEHLHKLNVKTDRRHDRRVLTEKEIGLLLGSTASAEPRYGLSGHQRALLYRLALETGLRASELRSLTVSSFDFERLTVTVRAAYSKRRREDELPLRRDTADLLKAALSGKHPAAPAFSLPSPSKTTLLFQDDLKAAGVVYEVDGKYADFHALRHSFVSNVVKGGATVKEAQTLARHSTPGLTLGVYAHIGLNDIRRVIDGLPATPDAQKMAKTGTDGESHLPYTCPNPAQSRASLDKSGQLRGAAACSDSGRKNGSEIRGDVHKSFAGNEKGTERKILSMPESDRRRRDSNPRWVAPQRFSRPSP